MIFYRIKSDIYQSGNFAHASGYGPVDDLWFLAPQSAERKRESWRINRDLPGIYIMSNAKKWPDFLGNGSSPPLFFVSERIVESLRAICVPLGRVSEIPITDIDAKALKKIPAPRYFVVETIPGISVDLVATGYKVDAEGHAILDPPPHPRPTLFHYDLDSWNGADLFGCHRFDSSGGPHLEMLCTERIKQLAQAEGWTNVSFERLRIKGINPFTGLPE